MMAGYTVFVTVSIYLLISIGLLSSGRQSGSKRSKQVRSEIRSEWPFFATLMGQDQPRVCGATILNTSFVVTSKSCADSIGTTESWRVLLGDDRRTYYLFNGTIAWFNWVCSDDKYSIRPTINGGKRSYLDFLIARLDRELVIDETTKPVSLKYTFDEFQKNSPKGDCVVLGHSEGDMNNLKITNVKIKYLPCYLEDKSQFCFEALDQSQQRFSTCSNDSGGPVLCKTAANGWNLVGIVSVVVDDCLNDPNKTGLYNVATKFEHIEKENILSDCYNKAANITPAIGTYNRVPYAAPYYMRLVVVAEDNRRLHFMVASLAIVLTTLYLCQISDTKHTRRTPRISSARLAKELEFPFYAWVRSKSRSCGGAIIGARYVVTLASCVKGQTLEVSAGHVERAEVNRNAIDVTHTCISGLYMKRDNKHLDDFALLRLAKPLTYSKNIDQVQYKNNTEDAFWFLNSKCHAIGAGYFDTANRLGKLQVSRVSIRGCIKNVVDSHICYTNLSKPSGVPCRGDLGGPIVCEDGRQTYLVAMIGSVVEKCNVFEAALNLNEAALFDRFRKTTLGDCLDWFDSIK